MAPAEHEVLVFLCQILVLLVAAKSLGWLLGKVGQPSVVGELAAGIVLGPSIFGRVSSGGFEWLFPDEAAQGAMLYGLAWLGLLLLLASAGFESDLSVIRRLGKPVVYVTIGSLSLPLIGGALVGLSAPAALLGSSATTVGFAAFLAVALSISSLPVVATVLNEMGMVRRNVGQMILATAIANDVIGWILLGVVAGLAESDSVAAYDIALTVASVGLFMVLAVTVGQRVTDRILFAVATTDRSNSPAIAVIAIVVGAGALTQWMGVEAVLGAFIAGLVVGRSRWRDERALHLVESLAHGILAPLFFATAGLRIDLGVFADRTVATWSVVIIVVASVTKFLGAVVGAEVGRLPRREGLALGAALNARGALEIVIASIGLSLGVLNDASYGAIVVMAIVTSVAAPPLLRAALGSWPGTEEEQKRLEAERVARSNVIISERPPLLVIAGESVSLAAAQVIDLCWPIGQPVSVITGDPSVDLAPYQAVFHERDVRTVFKGGIHSEDFVLNQAAKGHSAIIVGLDPIPGAPMVSPLAEMLIAQARRPVVLFRREMISGQDLPTEFSRAIVPITGSINSRAAQELGIAMSAKLGTELVLTHLDTTPVEFGAAAVNRLSEIADTLLSQAHLSASATAAGSIVTISRTAATVGVELASMALELEADLVIVGTTPRQAGNRTVLGPVASHLLEHCPTAVIVVTTPPGWTGPHQHQ